MSTFSAMMMPGQNRYFEAGWYVMRTCRLLGGQLRAQQTQSSANTTHKKVRELSKKGGKPGEDWAMADIGKVVWKEW